MRKFQKLLAFWRLHTHEILVDTIVLAGFVLVSMGLMMAANYIAYRLGQ